MRTSDSRRRPFPPPRDEAVVGSASRPQPTTRSPVGYAYAIAFTLVARVGSAVTLAALLVVVGTVLATVETAPVPTGASTTGR